jgi:hypothetical protein
MIACTDISGQNVLGQELAIGCQGTVSYLLGLFFSLEIEDYPSLYINLCMQLFFTTVLQFQSATNRRSQNVC